MHGGQHWGRDFEGQQASAFLFFFELFWQSVLVKKTDFVR
jgi:hypothetical protein